MKILFIGDIFGEIGREMIEDYLHRLVKDNQIDFVIANVENTSHGKGLLKRHYDELSFQGIQAMTMGNHTFDKKELYDYIDEADRLIVLLISLKYYLELSHGYLMYLIKECELLMF